MFSLSLLEPRLGLGLIIIVGYVFVEARTHRKPRVNEGDQTLLVAKRLPDASERECALLKSRVFT